MPQPNILEYLPEFLRNVKEIKVHADAERPELEAVWTAVDNAYKDQYLHTMTENGVSRWEKMLKITPMGTDTVEDRRFRIINRVNAQLPYTFKMLENHLIQMCGENNYTISYDKDTWTLSVKIGLTAKKQYNEVLDLINQMIPMNILLAYSLLYNTHEILGGFTHEQLSAYTHAQLREEVLTQAGG